MSGDYSRRQRAGNWPTKGRWSPDGLPPDYLELLRELAAHLTSWRHEHDPGMQLDPRHDPRGRERRHLEERAKASR
jgi:hypothetical protein